MRPSSNRDDITLAEALRESFETMDPEAKVDIRERVVSSARASRRRGLFVTAPQRLAAALVAGTTLLGGVAYAANGALPGDVLYPVKRAGEDVLVALLPSGALERHVLVGIAARRAEEAAHLESQGERQQTREMLNEFEEAVRRAIGEQGVLDEAEAARIREQVGVEAGTTNSEVNEIIAPQGPSGSEGPSQDPGTSGSGSGSGSPEEPPAGDGPGDGSSGGPPEGSGTGSDSPGANGPGSGSSGK